MNEQWPPFFAKAQKKASTRLARKHPEDPDALADHADPVDLLPGAHVIDLVRITTASRRGAVRLARCAAVPKIQHEIHFVGHGHRLAKNGFTVEVEGLHAGFPLQCVLVEGG